MDAAGGGHINLVELLLRHGADINAKDNDGTSVLMYACSSGSLELVKYLIMEGAKFWENDAFGCSSIQYALSCGSPHGSLISQYISGLTEKVQSISDTSDQTTSSDQTTGSSSTASGSDCQSGSESPTLSISDSSSPVFEEK